MSYDKISHIILTHWKNYHPKMVAEFQQENRLEAELEATAQQCTDLHYQLTVVQKMGYQEAWEIVTEQFLLPEEPEEEESSSTSRNLPDHPATSASPRPIR